VSLDQPSDKPLTLWDPADDQVTPTWSVVELGEAISAALRRSFPDEVWVRGEIRNLNRSNTGTVWFDLVEPAPGGDLARPAVGTLPVVLFDKARRRVNHQLREAGGAVRMENGTEVRIGGRVEYWGPRGRLQLMMAEIDPAFTLGRLAMDRERLLRQLRAEGLLERQQRLAFPLVPLRVGLVTSAGSAAEHDVLHELRHSGIGFRVQRVDARVQGSGAPRSVAAALHVLAGRSVDVVLLARGGGSATDLAAFDSEQIARAVAAMPVPVLTGIGHDIDHSVADDVAHAFFKTPTACAQSLVAAVREYDARLGALWDAVAVTARRSLVGETERLRSAAREVAACTRRGLRAADGILVTSAGRLGRATELALDRSTRSLARSSARVEAGARVHLRSHEAAVEAAARRLVQRAPQVVEAEQRRLDGLDVQVRAFDPSRALARGWSITRTGAGNLVRSPADAAPGDPLVTTVAGGTVHSTVHHHDREPTEPPP
jgi:exodeoxyribonuclease VII large subunit